MLLFFKTLYTINHGCRARMYGSFGIKISATPLVSPVIGVLSSCNSFRPGNMLVQTCKMLQAQQAWSRKFAGRWQIVGCEHTQFSDFLNTISFTGTTIKFKKIAQQNVQANIQKAKKNLPKHLRSLRRETLNPSMCANSSTDTKTYGKRFLKNHSLKTMSCVTCHLSPVTYH